MSARLLKMQRETLVSHPPGRLPSQSKVVCHDLHCTHPPTPCVGCLFSWGKPSSCVWVLFQLVFTLSVRMRYGDVLACPASEHSANKRDFPCYGGNIIYLQICPQIFVLLHEKSNFYFRNIYLPQSVCIYIPLCIQYLVGIFQTQSLHQQKCWVFNPCVALSNTPYPPIVGRKMSPMKPLSHRLSQQEIVIFVLLEGK